MVCRLDCKDQYIPDGNLSPSSEIEVMKSSTLNAKNRLIQIRTLLSCALDSLQAYVKIPIA